MLSTRSRAALRGKACNGNVRAARGVSHRMTTALRLLIAASLTVLAAGCASSVEHGGSSVQLPGEAPRTAGLQVPPDAWAHPTETASAPAASAPKR